MVFSIKSEAKLLSAISIGWKWSIKSKVYRLKIDQFVDFSTRSQFVYCYAIVERNSYGQTKDQRIEASKITHLQSWKKVLTMLGHTVLHTDLH